METHWTTAEKGEADDRLVEAEVLGVGADAEGAGVVVSERGELEVWYGVGWNVNSKWEPSLHDAVLGLFVFSIDTAVNHSLQQPVELRGHGRSLEDLRLRLLFERYFGICMGPFRVPSALALGFRLRFFWWHKTVLAAKMHSLAAQICPPCTFLTI